MRTFYEQVKTDPLSGRVYAACALCGARRYAFSLPRPVLFHPPAPVASGASAASLRRRSAALHALVRYFNRCEGCGRWVCDKCCDAQSGLCRECKAQGTTGASE